MRRLALLLAGGAIWLFLAAIPALADGGPHVASVNDGTSGITADSCAGCHRAHTAAGPFLINAADEEALCLTCHGAASTGSAVDVMTGVQYRLGANGLRSGTQLGATRNGGFDQARIGSGIVTRIATSTSGALRTLVPVLSTPQDVTSSHLVLPGVNNLTQPGIAWGNGPVSATPNAGPTVELSCASCHNPHGNGQYRILNPIPEPHSGTGFVPDTADNPVTDAALPPAGDTRNYTVIQTVATAPTLLASQVVSKGFGPLDGDYFHRGVPWDLRTNNDAPNGLPGTFNGQITQWCSSCHTRYYTEDDGTNPTGDAIFKYQHNTQSNRACTTCHVSHGSNAAMTADPRTGTTFAQNFPYPNGVISASSRLLKIDRRGTCQACHDPTGTIEPGDSTTPGPPPAPTTGSITGTVSAAGGGAISGATVQISGGASTTTNASGGYTFTGLAPATYSLTASATGYVTSAPANVNVTAGVTANQNFSLTATGGGGPTTGSITGTVSAAGGGAISGATVQISGGASTTTNASGVYTFTGLAPAAYSLTASATGYVTSAPANVNVTAGGTANQPFTLSASGGGGTGTLTGTVTSVGGSPITGALVQIIGVASTTTNRSGVYTLAVPAGTYTVNVSASGYLSTSASGVTVGAGGTTTRNFILQL